MDSRDAHIWFWHLHCILCKQDCPLKMYTSQHKLFSHVKVYPCTFSLTHQWIHWEFTEAAHNWAERYPKLTFGLWHCSQDGQQLRSQASSNWQQHSLEELLCCPVQHCTAPPVVLSHLCQSPWLDSPRHFVHFVILIFAPVSDHGYCPLFGQGHKTKQAFKPPPNLTFNTKVFTHYGCAAGFLIYFVIFHNFENTGVLDWMCFLNDKTFIFVHCTMYMMVAYTMEVVVMVMLWWIC